MGNYDTLFDMLIDEVKKINERLDDLQKQIDSLEKYVKFSND
jgi:tetrahydromethanopterin S-methyltransferase subunit G